MLLIKRDRYWKRTDAKDCYPCNSKWYLQHPSNELFKCVSSFIWIVHPMGERPPWTFIHTSQEPLKMEDINQDLSGTIEDKMCWYSNELPIFLSLVCQYFWQTRSNKPMLLKLGGCDMVASSDLIMVAFWSNFSLIESSSTLILRSMIDPIIENGRWWLQVML